MHFGVEFPAVAVRFASQCRDAFFALILESRGDPSEVAPVELPALSARRATVEDLPSLRGLWQAAGLPWDQLDRFVTEFQVVPASVDSDVLIGAVGFLVEGGDGLLHSEAVVADEAADETRAALWRRVQIIGRNQGVHRIWTQEDAAYWATCGFKAAGPEALAACKGSFLDRSASWLWFEYPAPETVKARLDEQMAIWQATRTQEAAALQERIRHYRNLAVLVATVVIGIMIVMLSIIMRQHPEVMQRLLHGGK